MRDHRRKQRALHVFRAPSAASVAVAALMLLAAAASASETRAADVAAGRAFAEKNCARCHAIGRAGPSPFAEAPPFRTFSKKWPVEYLEEALAEGIVVGHPAMPVFQLTPDEIDDLIAYLKSIQAK